MANQQGPKTAFGRYMVYKFIPQYANNVYGAVYMGAAVLIIIVGLRGLGTVASQIGIVPGFLLGEDGKVDATYVMAALFLEFALLMIMAIVTFFTPEEEPNHGNGSGETAQKSPNRITIEAATFKAEVEHLQQLTNDEIKVIDAYVNKLGENAKRLNAAKAEFFKALVEMKQYLKS